MRTLLWYQIPTLEHNPSNNHVQGSCFVINVFTIFITEHNPSTGTDRKSLPLSPSDPGSRSFLPLFVPVDALHTHASSREDHWDWDWEGFLEYDSDMAIIFSEYLWDIIIGYYRIFLEYWLGLSKESYNIFRYYRIFLKIYF